MSRKIIKNDGEYKEIRWEVKRKHHMPIIISINSPLTTTFTFNFKINMSNDIYKSFNQQHSSANFSYDRNGYINKQFYINADGTVLKWEK